MMLRSSLFWSVASCFPSLTSSPSLPSVGLDAGGDVGVDAEVGPEEEDKAEAMDGIAVEVVAGATATDFFTGMRPLISAATN
jgi:hypothetical protein